MRGVRQVVLEQSFIKTTFFRQMAISGHLNQKIFTKKKEYFFFFLKIFFGENLFLWPLKWNFKQSDNYLSNN